jgi:hypothetical protein
VKITGTIKVDDRGGEATVDLDVAFSQQELLLIASLPTRSLGVSAVSTAEEADLLLAAIRERV